MDRSRDQNVSAELVKAAPNHDPATPAQSATAGLDPVGPAAERPAEKTLDSFARAETSAPGGGLRLEQPSRSFTRDEIIAAGLDPMYCHEARIGGAKVLGWMQIRSAAGAKWETPDFYDVMDADLADAYNELLDYMSEVVRKEQAAGTS